MSLYKGSETVCKRSTRRLEPIGSQMKHILRSAIAKLVTMVGKTRARFQVYLLRQAFQKKQLNPDVDKEDQEGSLS